MEKRYTTEELADLLGVPVRWVYERTRLNLIPHERLPGSRLIRFKPAEITQWLAAGHMDGTGPQPRTRKTRAAA